MIEGKDYIFYNVIPPQLTNEVKQRCRMHKESRVTVRPHIVTRAYMTDELIVEILDTYHSNSSFSQLPEWLRNELRCRDIQFDKREPASYERKVTQRDLEEHQILNKDHTIESMNAMLKKGIML